MQEPILIYTHKLSTRLDYICKYIFRDVLGLPFAFTISEQKYTSHLGAKIIYSNTLEFSKQNLFIHANALLWQSNIEELNITVNNTQKTPTFFKTESNILPFDIFAASFYLLTRYEEYLPYTPDVHNRFPHTESLAFKNNFLHLPIINIWCNIFLQNLQVHYPTLQTQTKNFKHIITYDIDMAFSYKHKGFKRQVGAMFANIAKGNFKDLLLSIKVICNAAQDPFNTFNFIQTQHANTAEKPICFFLLGTYSTFDKNIDAGKKAMQNVIKHVQSFADVGIHPSYNSQENSNLISQEKNTLEKILAKPITQSRQHYIKNKLPQTYSNLITNNISADYSMGYGSINGFRASTCTPFKWFNLQSNVTENLQVMPFCWMDANSLYEQNFTAAQAETEFNKYFEICKNVNGTMVSIWHNSSLHNKEPWQNWQAFYVNTIQKK